MSRIWSLRAAYRSDVNPVLGFPNLYVNQLNIASHQTDACLPGLAILTVIVRTEPNAIKLLMLELCAAR